MMQILIANLKSSVADRTCARHHKANMEGTKESRKNGVRDKWDNIPRKKPVARDFDWFLE